VLLNGANMRRQAKEKWSLSRFFRPIRQCAEAEQLLREDSTFSIAGVVDDPAARKRLSACPC
jgi:hypothetical protein